MDGATTHRNGNTQRVASIFSIKKKIMKIAVLCKKGDYISSLSSLELLSLIPQTGLSSFVIYSQGSIHLTFDIHPTGEHYLKLVPPSNVTSKSLGVGLHLFPTPIQKAQLTWHIVNSSPLLN